VKDGQFEGRRITSVMQRFQSGTGGTSSNDQQLVAEQHSMLSSEPEVGERGMVGKLESVYRVSTSPHIREEVGTPHLEDVGGGGEEEEKEVSSSDSLEVSKKSRKKKGISIPFSKVSLAELNFWHHFFVHPGADRLHKTLLQRGIRVKMQDCQHVCDACEACSTCKRMYPGAWQHQEPEEEEIEAKINDKVSVDLLYLIRTRKFKVYALVFQDMMSGIVESVMGTNKDPKGVRSAFRCLWLDKHQIPKLIRMDNGTENVDLAILCERMGIRVTTTPPYGPTQNAKNERSHGTFLANLRTILKSSGFSPRNVEVLRKLVDHLVPWSINHVAASSCGMKTPIALSQKTEVLVTHPYFCGQAVMAKDPLPSQKLKERAVKVTFITHDRFNPSIGYVMTKDHKVHKVQIRELRADHSEMLPVEAPKENKMELRRKMIQTSDLPAKDGNDAEFPDLGIMTPQDLISDDDYMPENESDYDQEQRPQVETIADRIERSPRIRRQVIPLGNEREISSDSEDEFPRRSDSAQEVSSQSSESSSEEEVQIEEVDESPPLLNNIEFNDLSVGTVIKFIKNPKRPGCMAYKRYKKYKVATTVQEAMELGATRADLKYDFGKGFFKVIHSPAYWSAFANQLSSDDLLSHIEAYEIFLEKVDSGSAGLQVSSEVSPSGWQVSSEVSPSLLVPSEEVDVPLMAFAARSKGLNKFAQKRQKEVAVKLLTEDDTEYVRRAKRKEVQSFKDKAAFRVISETERNHLIQSGKVVHLSGRWVIVKTKKETRFPDTTSSTILSHPCSQHFLVIVLHHALGASLNPHTVDCSNQNWCGISSLFSSRAGVVTMTSD